jgi:hypothetical protein
MIPVICNAPDRLTGEDVDALLLTSHGFAGLPDVARFAFRPCGAISIQSISSDSSLHWELKFCYCYIGLPQSAIASN